MDYKDNYEKWCKNSFIDEQTKTELMGITDENEIQDRFYKNLEFGTGGMRGVIGAGTNRMNRYTIMMATQGLANFILKEGTQDKGVVIAYDSRNMSYEFSEYTANTLNANGIRAYVFESLRTVPELSYAVRKLGATAGIVITASHNPPKYNGYKVYWDDGAQITAPKDKLIIEEARKIESFENVKQMDKNDAINKGLYITIGKEIDDSYIEELKKLVLNPEAIEAVSEKLKIVYTPLHGTGNVPVRRILSEIGFKNVFVVEEQEKPDGKFPTVSFPNPEDEKAFELALKLAKEKDADVVLATDPDADRLGIYAKDSKTGEYMPFTGNMSGLLIAEYILSQKRQKGMLPKNGVMIKSIVSSNLARPIAKEYGIKLMDVLTGFKYIGEQMKLFEQTKEYEYLFGYEESYGCLTGTYARDKDAVAAVMVLCEAAAYYNAQGLTLWDQMIKMYEKYGYYKETIVSVTKEGANGAQEIKEIMEKLRRNPINLIGDCKVLEVKDYDKDEKLDLQTGKVQSIGLPKSNVLYYELENDSWCCVRPSGTEPKVKLYIGIKGNSLNDANRKIEKLKEESKKLLE